ncbi:DUF6941 family protein [Sphaerimonospora thailandensis]|uniref:Uncharacterized protein n=1 Tax=Sphaerimonospora thailandensis TaxID=795644 RepID=A0A8J3R4J2_9ACTN|nr:hypothetical protein [Sphaerimonospora thailandensis]GIH68977.1 hypothetical protein Mth01_12300 [Sphaerimonospora thailandensis]
MRGSLVLCDSAQQDTGSGKVHILGAGWSITGPSVPPMAVVAFLRVPWEAVDSVQSFAIRLLDDSDKPVMMAGGNGKPVQFAGRLTLGDADKEAESMARSVDVNTTFVINVSPLPLEPGHMYRWIFEVNDEELDSASFAVRASVVNTDL